MIKHTSSTRCSNFIEGKKGKTKEDVYWVSIFNGEEVEEDPHLSDVILNGKEAEEDPQLYEVKAVENKDDIKEMR